METSAQTSPHHLNTCRWSPLPPCVLFSRLLLLWIFLESYHLNFKSSHRGIIHIPLAVAAEAVLVRVWEARQVPTASAHASAHTRAHFTAAAKIGQGLLQARDRPVHAANIDYPQARWL